MSKKRNRKYWKIIFIILVMMVYVIGRNLYYDYKFSENNLKDSFIEDSNRNEKDNDLEELSDDNAKMKFILENRDNIPHILLEMLSRNLDMTDYVFHYTDYKGQVFANDIGDVTKGEYPLLLQYDKRWGYGMYGEEVIAINGCGPTSLAMVIAGLTGENDITPYDVATYSYQNGYYAGGTSWSLFTKGVSNYGIIGTELSLSKYAMFDELEQNHPIICSMRKGDFTTTGHIIVIVGVKDGKFIVNDPNSRERSNRLWGYEEIKSQIRNLWSFRLKE